MPIMLYDQFVVLHNYQVQFLYVKQVVQWVGIFSRHADRFSLTVYTIKESSNLSRLSTMAPWYFLMADFTYRSLEIIMH